MDEESIEFVKKYRGNLPTYYVKLDIQDFITYKYKNQMITDSRHCPSIELNLIWNEKIFMIQRALKINVINKKIDEVVQEIANKMSKIIKKYPEQYLWAHNRFNISCVK